MTIITNPMNILVSWVGQTDLNASQGQPVGLGPVAQVVTNREYDLVVLLSNYSKKETASFIKWLEPQSNTTIELQLADLTGPTNFGEIYEVVTNRIRNILKVYGPETRLTYNLSPGTPAMAAVWIIVAKTRYAAELIESSKKYGVRTANIPFDISAEFIPDLLKRPDNDVSRLSAGVSQLAPAFEQIIHQSAIMKRVINKAQKITVRSVPVLIEGESGTGKELLSRAIHEASPRQAKPFIAVNCGAISPELVESEFFGHKKGAFTSADTARKGHFESADGGTLFLDEIGELPLNIQVKLLRVLQEGEVVRVGESKPIPIDVRIISATNRKLTSEVNEGRFREDLFFRLAVAVLRLPPIRERAGDLNLLIDHLLEKINKESVAEPDWGDKKISAGGRNLLLQHTWPGNVRELQNTLTRAIVWSSGKSITKDDIQDALLESPLQKQVNDGILHKPLEEGIDLQGIISFVSKHYISRAMKETNGNKSKTAELLGLGSYQTLNNWIKKYGIE
jgi:DNA-binding NtrC family response regulator